MSGAGLAAGAALLAVLVVADLLLSPGYVARVRTAVAAGDPFARTRMYRLTVAVSWTAALAALAVLLAGGATWAEVGFGAPREGSLQRYAGVLVGLAGGLVAVLVAVRSGRGAPQRTVGDIDVLVPRTRRERRWFAAVAVTAGTTEEVVYRALALTVLLAVLPGRLLPVVVGAALFGLAHLYQGRAGVLVTAVLALALGWLYVDTGSLWPGMVLHVLLDLRVLLLPPPAP
ncbi:CPBP family intramembrane glutamic endopeptidase [Vallicoccus soli]|uniref:CPBP family intramembrane metalloprotease n=1 Tax=Vallicoccus soli TaxID=2339232 RepID=A0A3A3YS74_9ACTN|nr:CPBP family intramembrane glutamic endopeptidase [Vallicoccus soli]RJK94260.1 CPBP family intramembrane metalloprotease [Vallicoccus soli]